MTKKSFEEMSYDELVDKCKKWRIGTEILKYSSLDMTNAGTIINQIQLICDQNSVKPENIEISRDEYEIELTVRCNASKEELIQRLKAREKVNQINIKEKEIKKEQQYAQYLKLKAIYENDSPLKGTL